MTVWVNIYSIMCEQVANRAGRWSKERTYTRRAISSQYVVCAGFCAQYIYSWHKKRTYNHSYLKRTHLHRAMSAFVYKLFLLLMHLLLLCTSYFLLILRAIVASFYVPAITNHYKLGWSSQKGATLYNTVVLDDTHMLFLFLCCHFPFWPREIF